MKNNLPLTFRNMTLLTPAPILFFASHKKCPCASLVIFLKLNDPLLNNETFGSYKNSLYSPGVAPIALPFVRACIRIGILNEKRIKIKLNIIKAKKRYSHGNAKS